ncbi:Protein of unknown function DUF829, TMEM53 [Carpediemonas membranifera]|uniref:Transmembrane protein 53 n=1 Tax=Carpediemonas membranifera TaxID=201153 RepID=A0A8J6B4F7_9EUKA|nr:Protein of unknown function DUF829, TMEM53 [Carpediemonas membranifera]|eukprot:KAG9392789.1 Protein of unknown function DUF829, TMEM53 [Carpediemonas membranifera]
MAATLVSSSLIRKPKAISLLHTPPLSALRPEASIATLPNPPTATLLLGWLGSNNRKLRRYSEAYAGMGIPSIGFVPPMWYWTKPDLRQKSMLTLMDRLEAALEAQSFANSTPRLVVHAFSNNGALALSELFAGLGTSRYPLIARDLRVILDSAPAPVDPDVFSRAMSAVACAQVRRGRPPVYTSPVTHAMRPLFRLISARVHEIDIPTQLLTRWLDWPALLLYSRTDACVGFGHVERFGHALQGRGNAVTGFEFQDSYHCAHILKFPSLYRAIIRHYLLTTGARLG